MRFIMTRCLPHSLATEKLLYIQLLIHQFTYVFSHLTWLSIKCICRVSQFTSIYILCSYSSHCGPESLYLSVFTTSIHPCTNLPLYFEKSDGLTSSAFQASQSRTSCCLVVSTHCCPSAAADECILQKGLLGQWHSNTVM